MQDLSDLQILNHSSRRTLPGIVSPESAKLYLRNPLVRRGNALTLGLPKADSRSAWSSITTVEESDQPSNSVRC
jgi:hypothetical protein